MVLHLYFSLNLENKTGICNNILLKELPPAYVRRVCLVGVLARDYKTREKEIWWRAGVAAKFRYLFL